MSNQQIVSSVKSAAIGASVVTASILFIVGMLYGLGKLAVFFDENHFLFSVINIKFETGEPSFEHYLYLGLTVLIPAAFVLAFLIMLFFFLEECGVKVMELLDRKKTNQSNPAE